MLSMTDALRDTLAGQVIRILSGNRLLRYSDERPGFTCPTQANDDKPSPCATLESLKKEPDFESGALPYQIVGWYSDDDPENPHNWSARYRYFVLAQIGFLTFASYGSAAIIVPGIPSIMEEFGVSEVAASLTLGIYLMSWSVAPLFMCPCGEMPTVGRNIFYAPFMWLFLAFQVGAALAPNFGSLLAFRFLTGLCGAPALASGGATLADMVSDVSLLPIFFSWWAFGAVSGVSGGPVISSFAVQHFNTWRASMWITLGMTGAATLLVTFCLPETLASNILHKRAKRLRKLTGNGALRSQGEVNQAKMSTGEVLAETLWRPTKLAVLDPSIGFTHLYIGLVYSVQYLFFVGVPKLETDIYNWSIGVQGISFLSLGVGCSLGMVAYLIYQYGYMIPYARQHRELPPERALLPALIGCLLPPIGLYIFAGSARASVNFMGALSGLAIFGCGIFVLFQCIFLYISLVHPRYAASVLGGNDVVRSGLAGAMQPVGVVMYDHLGVQNSAILCGSILLAMVVPLYLIWWKGSALRQRSRFVSSL